MKKILIFNLSILFFISISFCSLQQASGFTQITAQEAYDMLNNAQATLIDVRTEEECAFVGNPALAPGGEPIAYIIPFKLFSGFDEAGNKRLTTNPDFNALIEQAFGNDKNRPLIVMCAVGSRSTYAAERLEDLGYYYVYEIDNEKREKANYPGGSGGFSGPGYDGSFSGYKGYPLRLSTIGGPDDIKVQTVTADITNADDSVSWMDTGLPITERIDPGKIPKIKKTQATSTNTTNIITPLFSLPSVNYQTSSWSKGFMQQPGLSSGLIQPFSFISPFQSLSTGFGFPFATNSFSPAQPLYQSNQWGSFYTKTTNPIQSSLDQYLTLLENQNAGCGG